MTNISRRQSLQQLLAVTTVPLVSPFLQASEAKQHSHLIATNTYPWLTFARRNKHEFNIHSDQLLSDISSTGINGYEPIIESPSEFSVLKERLPQHQLQMPSIYVNSLLHDKDKVSQSIEEVLAIAEAAVPLGVKIIVTNPSPIRWGGTEDKTDPQLRLQGKSLDSLGQQLRQRGITLAYHNHDAELRQGGREFHHMLTATDPANVKLCLDAHWVYRGCGNSEVAVFDALTHYHERIVELHLRQSVKGIWTEAFAMQGDIDYQRLMNFLTEQGIKPHLVLEQAVEAQSPQLHTATAAHKISYENLKKATA